MYLDAAEAATSSPITKFLKNEHAHRYLSGKDFPYLREAIPTF